MLFLKQLRLENYCGYISHTFDFFRSDGTPYPFVCFFGPNGIGKTTLLNAIAMLTMDTSGRGARHVVESLQKYIYNTDYDPTVNRVKKDAKQTKMLIEGTYEIDGKDYIVRLTGKGWDRNDLAPLAPADVEPEERARRIQSGPWGEDHMRFRRRVSHYIRSDSDLGMNKFQIILDHKSDFEEIVSEIMRFPAECLLPMSDKIQDREYCTDFVITKKNKTRTHFRSMSAGERKICKSFSDTLNLMHNFSNPIPGEPSMDGWPRLLLLDNVVMHVYYDRHIRMVECLKHIFSRQQIFATTHSGVLIPRAQHDENDQKTELYIDIDKING